MNYKYHIFCCVNERKGDDRSSCKKKNAHLLRNYIKQKVKEKKISRVRVNQSGCLDKCEKGPVIVIYPKGLWYKCETFRDADEIVSSLESGITVKRLIIEN